MAKKLTPYLAVAIAEGFCEGERASKEDQIKAWQYLIDNGICWKLQGWFGRTAVGLIDAGICKPKYVKLEKGGGGETTPVRCGD